MSRSVDIARETRALERAVRSAGLAKRRQMGATAEEYLQALQDAVARAEALYDRYGDSPYLTTRLHERLTGLIRGMKDEIHETKLELNANLLRVYNNSWATPLTFEVLVSDQIQSVKNGQGTSYSSDAQVTTTVDPLTSVEIAYNGYLNLFTQIEGPSASAISFEGDEADRITWDGAEWTLFDGGGGTSTTTDDSKYDVAGAAGLAGGLSGGLSASITKQGGEIQSNLDALEQDILDAKVAYSASTGDEQTDKQAPTGEEPVGPPMEAGLGPGSYVLGGLLLAGLAGGAYAYSSEDTGA